MSQDDDDDVGFCLLPINFIPKDEMTLPSKDGKLTSLISSSKNWLSFMESLAPRRRGR